MKKLILVLILSISSLYAQTPDHYMKAGNKYYHDGQYEAAIQSYQKILSQGYESGALYFNIGNSYFKIGKIGYAIFNYEKGLKLEPNDDDLVYNLRIANSHTFDKIQELPKLFIVAWWEGLITAFSVNGWSVLVIIFFLIFISSIASYFFVRRAFLQRIAFMVGSISMAVLILTVVFLFARVGREASTNYGILLAPTYTVKASPDIKSNDAFVIHEGIKFTLEDNVNDWVKIRLADGKIGWVQRDSLGQI
jgi:tetratricopeptide (TPR) repeat protein